MGQVAYTFLELYTCLGLAGALAAIYPLRLLIWGYRHQSSSRRIPIYIPLSFDPAPLLYPPTITLLVSALISTDNEAVLLPNIILALCSIPSTLFPALQGGEVCNPLHWLVTCAPLFVRAILSGKGSVIDMGSNASLDPEILVLLYPLHLNLCMTLHSLTTTSLLTAELQLLSVALLNVLLTSTSPQMVIIKAMLWVGGLDILVLCTHVILWGISLARVPKWRFRRVSSTTKRASFFSSLTTWRRVRHDLFHTSAESSCSSCEAVDDSEDSDGIGGSPIKGLTRVQTATLDGADSSGFDGAWSSQNTHDHDVRFNLTDQKSTSLSQRRHTLPALDKPRGKVHTHTPSGRRKRSASSSVRAFFSLTQSEAAARKWLYALYVYVCIVGVIFVPLPTVGVKDFVQKHALHGYEPVGWALGYLLGDLPWFRWQVVSNNLERWVLLPARIVKEDLPALGWVDYLREAVFGEANTRLLLSAYYVAVILCGLVVVFRLSPFYEVDTRRKVFHFMMVAMFAPSIYIDPTYIALALSIILAAFLLLDLLRASQLPPLSKPIAFFLAPYVDGRDLRGPVVISHIFLLIGCAIPLWLSLGALPRTGSGYLEGWEVPTRDVSMVAGVICVGLGDAAASLIGRRWGHRKWLWGGGKSLEGSVAFATAVFIGLMAAHLWLRIGGWPQSVTSANNFPLSSLDYPLPAAAAKSGVCATMASLTEAVLTGGNDNVIVPVVLWTCVKSLGV
jgi:dolichol kinase